MPAVPADLAVIIVSWNTRDLTLDAIRTVVADLSDTDLDWAVWVVDNASTDGTIESIRSARFPRLHLIANPENVGFARGNNIALRELGFSDDPKPNPNGPRAVFLLNPDTLTHPGAVRAMFDTLMTEPYAGLVGAYLTYEDGSFQHSAFRFPGLIQITLDLFPLPNLLRHRLYDSGLNGRYPRKLYASGKPFSVEHTLGATMMIRREAIEATGIFDEDYFMYVEEIDWSMRIRRAGWEIYVVPTAHITHLEGRSTRQVRPRSLVNLWTSRFRFYRKFYTPLRALLACFWVKVGMRLQIGALQRAVQRGKMAADEAEMLIAAYREVLRA